ncbi:MAG: hypothetical protein GX442_04115 [Candidatus Riflebacteria bacterium]|nr:hypothetical protein [Candidatus Riflebacteria bacterium]
MRPQLRPPTLQGRRAIALVVVLIAAFCMLSFFAAFQFFSHSEYRHLERILTNTSLDYLVRAGLNIAEDKLQKDRWYGDTRCRGSFEVPSNLLPPTARITIYADDYYASDTRKIGNKKYKMLDHIKVFVKASLRDRSMYGYGKYIMTPNPTAWGKSTEGIDMSFSSLNPSTHTFRKMVNVKLLREEDLEEVPGFSRIDLDASRKALGDFLRKEMHQQAFNFARNLAISRNLAKGIASPQPTYSLAALKSLLASKGSTAGTGFNENQLKNFFILESMKDFFMTTNWDIPDSEKQGELQKVRIEIGHFPPDEMTADAAAAIRIVFGGTAKRARDGVDYFKVVRAGPNGSAFAEFLKKRDIPLAPDKSPQDLQEELSRGITDFDYSFIWQAINAKVGTTIVPVYFSGGAASFILYYTNQGTLCDSCTYSRAVGPIPKFTNYYMVKDSIYMPLAIVFNFFMKFVDESYTYFPDSVVKDEGSVNIPVPPDTETGGGGGWGGVSG